MGHHESLAHFSDEDDILRLPLEGPLVIDDSLFWL